MTKDDEKLVKENTSIGTNSNNEEEPKTATGKMFLNFSFPNGGVCGRIKCKIVSSAKNRLETRNAI